MKLTVLAPAAQAELDGAVDWYEECVEGLGMKFLLLVDQALQEIQASPTTFPRWEHDARFRKFVMQRFPYIVFYRELADQMIKSPESVARCLNLMVVSKSLERIADHATNVAEEVVYLCEALDILHTGKLRRTAEDEAGRL